ncbi:MAG: LamG domain-containing protein [Candidatus Omnitrophica bacterium]|nr:LamG domain-containing protein [Candidatus Omnitrophota bacterium]
MRKSLIAFLLLICSVFALAADIQFYPFPFIGKWNPTEDPMLIADYGLQDIQNLRKDGKHFKGVKGHTKINTTVLSDLYVVNGFHFVKDQPAESHVIVYAGDATTPTTGHLYQNTTAIPGAGDFSSTVLYTPTTFTDTFRFSNAPQGNMVSSNAAETLIWGGNELPETAFLTSSATVNYTVTNSYDLSDILNNTSTSADQVANLSTGIDAYTVLLLHGNGADASTTITDSASGAKAVTAVGNAQIDTSYKKFGTGSILFDGTGDYATVPDSADWYFGAGDFTIDWWSRANYTGNTGICGQYVDVNNYWMLGLSLTQLLFKVVVGGVTKADYSCVMADYVTNTWYHFELVRSGSTMYLFRNGTSKTLTENTAISTNEVPNLAAVLEIGASSNHANVFAGSIDEFRISKGIARHTANFSVPTKELGNASNYFLVGSKRPLQGVKFYVSTANTETSTLTVKEWTGSAWASLTATDNTSSGGKTLAQTGTVTWSSTASTSKLRYISGLSLYWYQFYYNAGSPSIYYVTTDAPMQSIKNIWDGAETYTVKVNKYDGTTYTDYTSLVGDQDDTSTYADVSSLPTTSSIILGYLERQQGFDISLVATKVNSTDNTQMTVQYWDGSNWVNVNALSDGTATANKSLNKSGVVVFTPVDAGQEFKQQISDTYPLYYYKITFANTIGANVYISEIYGIPFPPTIPAYKFSANFQNRLFLFNETNGDRNKATYSVYNSPDIFNGDDSGELYFGDNTEIIAAAGIYNVFNTTGGIEQLIVTKKNETYRVTGSSPSTWSVQRISTNVGCIAPLTMVSADMTNIENVKRQVAIWMSDKGVFISDGATVTSISDDISCYFDPNNSKYIPAAMMSKSVGWYDPALKSYKLLIASGSGSTYLNTELEYSLVYQEWTKIYRAAGASANPLQSGWKVTDTNGGTYSFGGAKNGYVYRLENGNTFDGTDIASYLWTKDIIIDQAAPLARLTTAKYLRTTHKKKATGAITITHYGDGTATTSGTNGQMGPANISVADALAKNFDSQSLLLGPNLTHSFKFAAGTNVTDGLELTGFGIYYEPYSAMRQ